MINLTEQWITTTLKDLLDPTGTVVILEDLGHGVIQINVSDMANIFSSVTPSYANLSATPQAGSGGWQQYFDDWKAKGLIV